jgi:hypothetical protein
VCSIGVAAGESFASTKRLTREPRQSPVLCPKVTALPLMFGIRADCNIRLSAVFSEEWGRNTAAAVSLLGWGPGPNLRVTRSPHGRVGFAHDRLSPSQDFEPPARRRNTRAATEIGGSEHRSGLACRAAEGRVTVEKTAPGRSNPVEARLSKSEPPANPADGLSTTPSTEGRPKPALESR